MKHDLRSRTYNAAHVISHVRSENFLIHSHPFYEIWYILSGDVHTMYGGTEYAMKPHTLQIYVPNVFHGIHVLSEEPYNRFTFHFTPEALPPEHRDLFLSLLPSEKNIAGAPIPHIIPNADRLGMPELVADFDQLDALPLPLRDTMASVLLETILARLVLRIGKVNSTLPALVYSAGGELTPILAYIHENLTERFSLDELCGRFHLSKSKLNALFHQQLDTTAMGYITRRRLSYAQQLLLNGFPASQAAAVAGFGDYTSFYRAYLKQMGHSPAEDKRTGAVTLPDPFAEGGWKKAGALRDADELDIWSANHSTNVAGGDPGSLEDP